RSGAKSVCADGPSKRTGKTLHPDPLRGHGDGRFGWGQQDVRGVAADLSEGSRAVGKLDRGLQRVGRLREGTGSVDSAKPLVAQWRVELWQPGKFIFEPGEAERCEEHDSRGAR